MRVLSSLLLLAFLMGGTGSLLSGCSTETALAGAAGAGAGYILSEELDEHDDDHDDHDD